ncbi:MAG: rane protein [Fibrobacteres bacterium]|nr:rane protein [Fibrobacterota bacterium]
MASTRDSPRSRPARPSLSWSSVWTLVKGSAKAWSDDKASWLAAALSFYTIFSPAPLLIMAIGVVGIVFGKESAKDVNNPRILEVQSAYQDLQNDLNTVPGGRTTVGEAADSLRADARDLRSAWDRLYTSMECGA